MLSGELARSAQKLQREQKQRSEALQRKAEREKAVQERLRKQREAHEEELRQRRLVELAAAEAVLLPASVGDDLMRQDAPKNGAQLFEIASSSGNTTHAGASLCRLMLELQPKRPLCVLAFTAAEGTIGMPPQVARNAFGDGASVSPEGATVDVLYRRLPKGEYVRFQPWSADFQREVGGDVRAVLEAALERHSTLSEGDWISVPFAGTAFDLTVQKLRPGRAVSVIDTEMEAEVEPSLETEQRLAQEEAARAEADRRREQELAAMAQEALRQAAEAEEREKAEQAALSQAAVDLERLRQEKAAALPPEPPADEAVTSCLIRLPNGARFSRRFRASDPLLHLFDFVDAQEGAGEGPGSYRLVAQFPRRVIGPHLPAPDATLADVGLASRQEVLLLEPLRS
ncbi:hypothetical protein COCSUDRAFT_43901 [Coccomyxa subellipsoidea C-169]|uniref:UBX domain-containing protein n=1 Tax=Coccomyxa subellipsoidea (strain C-169) TaxID=574566 RepID=I0YPZ2_COCSC|nr:hypothetical protein COCSUDRAFT_43901 [Coccomyxa subellipsoidea C-169]EIE20461.1 hypothetical protein COCSUDRAFT_43901 [Coccomyxa subellipsoidea C-169]|eukprot:XP_005645005.1 hypothetical protein COCSUDRAFT_43901 [Coccomyxa subellipsoidea C-169]